MSTAQRSLLVALNGVNYGASVGSATAETATTPVNVASGAIAMFYFNETNNDWELVKSGTPGTFTYPSYKKLLFVQGVPQTSNPTTNPINVPLEGQEVKVYSGKAYLAPTNQVFNIGYDGTLGSGIPVVASANYTTTLVNVTKQYDPYFIRKNSVITSPATNATQYSIAAQMVADMNTKNAADLSVFGWIATADIIGNGTATTVTSASSGTNKSIIVNASGAEAVTGSIAQGSTALTFTLAGSTVSSVNFAVGDFIAIAGTTYTIAGIGATGAITLGITLDRPYVGTTLSTAAATNFKFYNSANPTVYGVQGTVTYSGYKVEIALQDTLQGVYKSYSTLPTVGSGTYSEVRDLEQKAFFARSIYKPGATFPDPPPTYTVIGETYSILTLTWNVLRENMAAGNGSSEVAFQKTLNIAVPTANVSEYASTFTTYLNTWAASLPVPFPNIALS